MHGNMEWDWTAAYRHWDKWEVRHSLFVYVCTTQDHVWCVPGADDVEWSSLCVLRVEKKMAHRLLESRGASVASARTATPITTDVGTMMTTMTIPCVCRRRATTTTLR